MVLFITRKKASDPNTHSIDLEATSSQYLSITDASQTGLDLTTDFTIEAWVNPESQPGTYTIASKYQESGSNRNYIFQYFDDAATKKLRLLVNSNGQAGNNTFLDITQTLSNATWAHVAVTYDLSAGQAEFFVNGSSIGTVSGGPTTLANGTAEFQIGAEQTNGQHWDGLIDEVRIWNDIRTGTEISNNRNKQLTGSETNLQGYWELNNDLLDKTSNNNDLTNNNAATFSTDVPFS